MGYNDSDLISSIRDREECNDLIGENDPRFAVEFGQPDEVPLDRYYVIQFVEPMRFHVELDERLGDGHIKEVTNEDGYLTDETRKRLVEYLKGLFAERYSSIAGLELESADYLEFDDEPSFALELVVPAEGNEDLTLLGFVDKFFYPFYAAMVNVTDPGTFNHPYLFSEV